MLSDIFVEKAKSIKLIIFDVDGIFTDGHIYLNDAGIETKAFHVLDGQGIKLLQQSGMEIAVISGREAPGVALRMQYLGIRHIFQGQSNKLQAYQELLHRLVLKDNEVSHMGDDLLDIPLLTRVGLPVTVPHAVKEVRECTPFITQAKGGKGAVREVCEALLKAQGKWENIISQYFC